MLGAKPHIFPVTFFLWKLKHVQTIVKRYLFEFQASIFIATMQLIEKFFAPIVPSFF